MLLAHVRSRFLNIVLTANSAMAIEHELMLSVLYVHTTVGFRFIGRGYASEEIPVLSRVKNVVASERATFRRSACVHTLIGHSN